MTYKHSIGQRGPPGDTKVAFPFYSVLLQATVAFLFVNETVAMIMGYVALQYQAVVVSPGSLESLTLRE